MKTAKAEHRTLKMPFNAQYQGVSGALADLTNRIPVGKKNPIRTPSGEITNIDTITFSLIGEVIMFDSITGRANLIPMIARAMVMG